MIGVFRESGYPVQVRSEPDVIEVSFPTVLTPEGRRRFEERERIAAVAAVGHVLRPASVVVVGASRHRGTVGGEVLHNLVQGGFTGRLIGVNPDGQDVEGVPVARSVRDLAEPAEMAVIAVPAADVLETARACGEIGVMALVILSAGFAELGDQGAERQRELLDVCRAAGMRIVGPNCLGVLNTDPAISMNATSAPEEPPAGRVAFGVQSGAIGIAAIDLAAERSIGLASFVSAGDKADLSGNDFIQFWEDDSHTEAILLYVESFGNPRKFGHITRRVSHTKPVIAVKSGHTPAWQHPASTHTGAMVAASDATVDALFAHAGVIRTQTIGEMFDGRAAVAPATAARRPRRRGDERGRSRHRLRRRSRRRGTAGRAARRGHAARVASAAFAEASVVNPVDMLASASASDYARALELVLADPDVDAVIALFVRQVITRAQDVAAAVAETVGAPRARETPVLAVFVGADRPAPGPAGERGVPVFATAEEAARALGHAVRHARRRRCRRIPRRISEGLILTVRRRSCPRRWAPAAAGLRPRRPRR